MNVIRQSCPQEYAFWLAFICTRLVKNFFLVSPDLYMKTLTAARHEMLKYVKFEGFRVTEFSKISI